MYNFFMYIIFYSYKLNFFGYTFLFFVFFLLNLCSY